MIHKMSGTSVNLVEIVPLPVVPLPTCHARAKQLQAGPFNEIPFPTAYIANCRLCLGTKFGNGSTTIIDEQFITMMKQVFPILIVNQICLPMNVCTSCVKIVEAFYTFSSQVLANQMKLHEASTIRIPPEHDNVRVRSRDNPASNRESQEDLNQEIPIDTDLLIKLEKENDQQAPTDPLAIAADVVFDVIDEIPGIKNNQHDLDPLATVEDVVFDVIDRNPGIKNVQQHPDPIVTLEDIVFDVIDEIPGIKLEEEASDTIEMKCEDAVDLQLDVTEEISIEPPRETIGESEKQDPILTPKPKKRHKNGSIRLVHFCPKLNSSLKIKQISSKPEIEEFNQRLEEDDFMEQVIHYLRIETGESRPNILMNKSLDVLFDKQFFATCCWIGNCREIPIKNHAKILELFSKLGSSNGVNMSEPDIRIFFKHKFRNSKRRVKLALSANEIKADSDAERQEYWKEKNSNERLPDTIENCIENANDTLCTDPLKKQCKTDAAIRVVHLCLAHNTCSFKVKRISSESQLKEFNCRLKEDDFMKQVINYLQFETGESRPDRLMNKSLDILFERQFFINCSWRPHGKQIGLQLYKQILELFSRLGAFNEVNLPGCKVRDFFILKTKNAKRRANQITAS